MKRIKGYRKLLALVFASAMLNIPGMGSIGSADDTPPEAPAYKEWQVVGPTGGDVRVVAIDPKDKDRLYMSTLDGQIHTSSDGGATWRLLVNLNQPELVLDQLFVDARDSKIIYASGHRHKAPGGFFRSTDGGVTWKESKELKNESIHAMTQSTLDPNQLIAGTTNGVWISKNSGSDWEKIDSNSMPVNVNSLAMDPRNTSTMYAGTWWRAYKTTDSGQSWRLIKNGMIDDSDVFAMTVDPRNPEHVIASACSGIYQSQNGGERWVKVQGIPSQSRRTRDILQHPTIAGIVYAATTEGFWMTTNGGRSWALTTQRNIEINSVAVHPDAPNRVFIGTNNYGVMVSNDGGRNFTPTNGNFSSRLTYFASPDVEQHDRLYAATHNTASGGGYFFVSADGGRTWVPGRNLDTSRIRIFAFKQDPSNPNLMYLGTNLGIYRSVDRGNSWAMLPAAKTAKPPAKSTRRVKRPVKKAPAKKPVKKTVSVTAKNSPPAAVASVPEPTPVKLVPELKEKVKVIEFAPYEKGTLLVGTDSGVYRSRDLTKGWEKLPLPAGMNTNIFAIHISPARPETIWVGTATSGVLVSRDNGATWERTGGAVSNVPVSSIASDPERPDYIYVGTIQTFYLSRDNGKTWSRRGGNLSLGNFTSILINPTNTDEIILSSALDTEVGLRS
ncbi:MAG: WD40/YVTN/BNR-like repeat-containing protein, partial [Pyrinomonadaceae bacterium]